jgi:hypothetical protein
MQPIRCAGLTLALLLVMTLPAAADPTVQQLESNVRTSLTLIGSTTNQFESVHALPSFKAAVAPEVTERRVSPLVTTVRRVMNMTGGWRISAGISPGEQTLGVAANGHAVVDRWTNFHISVGLPLR